MVVYKFGGAAVRDKQSIQSIKALVAACKEPLVVVVSAMGKTTNRLEEIVKSIYSGKNTWEGLLTELRNDHLELIDNLMVQNVEAIRKQISELFESIHDEIHRIKDPEFNYFYDQVVTMGEVVSTKIVSAYLLQEGIQNQWIDIRKNLITDSTFREALVDCDRSGKNIRNTIDFDKGQCFVTQGFIGSDPDGNRTSLGREGSDYSAALIGSFLDADRVVLWKDVEGIYSADPDLFETAVLLEKIDYREVIKLAFYGAKVVHPKTIKPLREKGIPLRVRSFSYPDRTGTEVRNYSSLPDRVPNIILKPDQVLITISLEDLSFVSEKHLSKLFGLLNRFRLKANLMQHSAIGFSICVDEPRGREVNDLIDILRAEFMVRYNDGLNLYTIRHYDEQSIQNVLEGKKTYVEQRSRSTVQYLTS